jgi:DnaJ-class molecular chaperone
MYKVYDCKVCNGNGYLIIKNSKCNGKYRFERVKCEECNGSGIIRKIIN